MEHLERPSTLSVRELVITTLTERPRITLHEIERAAAIQGHSSIEVEIVLKSLLRRGTFERVTVFQLRAPDADVSPLDAELCEVRTVSSTVDLAESSRVVADAAIAKMKGPRQQRCERTQTAFWQDALVVLNAIAVGVTHHLIHPERSPALLAKQTSCMLCNWRRDKMLPARFKCRRSVQGVLITRVS